MTDPVRQPDEVEIDGKVYRRGDRLPATPPKIEIRPAFTGPGKPSFHSARHGVRAPGK